MARTSQLRGRQLTTGGHGTFFPSPARKGYRKKQSKVYIKNSSGRYQGLHAKLQQLRKSVDDPLFQDDTENDLGWQDDPGDMDYNDDGSPVPEPVPNPDPLPQPSTPDHDKAKRRILPNEADFREYKHWKENVGQMVDAYLSYTNRSLRKPAERIEVIERDGCECVDLKSTTLTCLYFDRTYFNSSHFHPHSSDYPADFRTIQVPYCACRPLHQVLVHHGLFPSAPQQPKIAVSLELLGFYRAMFERSCDAVHALANALHSFYTRRGYHVLDEKV